MAHNSRTIPSFDDNRMPRAADDDWPVMAVQWNLGQVPSESTIEKVLTFAYDDVFSIHFFGTPFQPYWRRNGTTAGNS